MYQVGQLLGMLIKGDAAARIRTPRSARLPCSDHLKEIIYRCIGERRKRYESADELIEALRNAARVAQGRRLRSLKGVHLAFTGILSNARSEADAAARRAGAIVHSAPSAQTTVVVRGRPNPLQAAGRDARPEADGDQTAAREGPPNHAAQRDAVLAARRGEEICVSPDEPTPRYLDDVRLIAGAFTLALLTVSVGAQTSRLGDVVARLDGYLQGYEDRLANIVAEETYRQWVEQGPTNRRSTTSRMLRSDFALTLTPNATAGSDIATHSKWTVFRCATARTPAATPE